MDQFGIKDIIDIVLVALFLYEAYILMRKTGATALFLGVLTFVAVWVLISQVFELRLMGSIMDKFISVGFILLVIVFQKEIRAFLQALGSNKGLHAIAQIFKPKNKSDIDENLTYIMPVVLAAINMSKRKEGALIAIQQFEPLDTFVETGELLDARISVRLIENIFFKNSPLHDGAMIIAGKRIKSVACILPVSQRQDIPKSCGLRHRSALGLAEQSDAKIIIVSEETGKVSLAYQSQIYIGVSAEELQKMLTNT